MRLFEAILDANHRAVSGDGRLAVPLDDLASALAIASPARYSLVT